MRAKRDVTPYMGSSDIRINAALSIAKVYKRLRTINPGYKPPSRYQARLKHKQVASRPKLEIVR